MNWRMVDNLGNFKYLQIEKFSPNKFQQVQIYRGEDISV